MNFNDHPGSSFLIGAVHSTHSGRNHGLFQFTDKSSGNVFSGIETVMHVKM